MNLKELLGTQIFGIKPVEKRPWPAEQVERVIKTLEDMIKERDEEIKQHKHAYQVLLNYRLKDHELIRTLKSKLQDYEKT